MTQEEKQLLLADLCARFPYFVQVNINGEIQTLNSWADDDGNYFNFLSDESDGNYGEGFTLDEVKPYLRPMSSMTDEEKEHCGDLILHAEDWISYYDYLDSRYLDYRGLIEKGLALEAPENMYEAE